MYKILCKILDFIDSPAGQWSIVAMITAIAVLIMVRTLAGG
jgi:hypothetical protein